MGRFRDALIRNGNLEIYQEMLASAFNPAALENIMCRSIVSVGWDGRLYDCDFNQALGLGLDSSVPLHIRDFDYAVLSRRVLTVNDHCFGCTAGQGSSCAGATTSKMVASEEYMEYPLTAIFSPMGIEEKRPQSWNNIP